MELRSRFFAWTPPTSRPVGLRHDNVDNDRRSDGADACRHCCRDGAEFWAPFPELAEQVARDPGLIFLSGILLFVAGLAIVRDHNVWVGGWPVLVTVLGWVAVLSGLLRMLFPTRLAQIAGGVAPRPGGILCC